MKQIIIKLLKYLLFFTGIAFVIKSIISVLHIKNPRRRIFFISIITSICVTLVDWKTDQIRELDDFAFDIMNKIYVDSDKIIDNEFEGLYIFVDIDEDTYIKWGEPLHVPRDKLQSILSYVLSGSPLAVIVDLDLTFPGIDKGIDLKFTNYIKRLSRGKTNLIFMRNIEATTDKGMLPSVKNNFFESDVEVEKLSWSLPIYLRDESDAKIRRWRLSTPVCIDGKSSIMFAPNLVAANLISHKGYALRHTKLQNQLELNNCQLNTNIDDRSYTTLTPEDTGFISTSNINRIQRILYSYSYNPSKYKFGRPNLGYSRIPAKLIDLGSGRVSRELINGSVVVIGTSHSAARDMYRTPVGEMPGAMIILNSVKSLRQYGSLPKPSLFNSVLISIFVAFSVVLLYLAYMKYFSPFVPKINTVFTASIYGKSHANTSDNINISMLIEVVVLSILVSILIPLSFYIFEYGIWKYTAIPIVAIYLSLKIAK